MSTPISALMQRRVWSAGFDDPVQEVEAEMTGKGLSWMPVVESEGTVMGVISVADIMRFHADGKDASKVRAWQLCTYKPITVRPEASVSEVAQLMVERGIHHVVVTDGTTLCGVVSSLDFVRTFIAGR